MRKGLTELVFIIDRSGSMMRMTDDTIGGFNAMLEKMRHQDGEALISTVLFNEASHVIYDRADISTVRDMTRNDYQAGGSTALLDAIGDAVHHIGNVHKYARREDVPEHTMFVITTDGMENASCRYTSDHVKQMIQRQQKKYGWEFLFFGANIDAIHTAGRFGIAPDRAVDYHCDAEGIALNYDVMAEAACQMRRDGRISRDWKDRVDRDYRERKDNCR